MLNAVTRMALVPLRVSAPKPTLQSSFKFPNFVRSFKTNATLSNSERETHFVRRAKERMGLKDRAMGPTTGTPFKIGQGLVAGGAVFGLGGLCYYGLGMSQEAVGNSIADRSIMWPQYVRERVKDTYLYFGGSIALTAASAMSAFRSPAVLNMMMKNSWVAIGATLAAMIGTGIVVRSMPYKPGFGGKQIGWMVHSAVMGVVLCPMLLMGGPLLTRAAIMTSGIVGGLSAIAMSAPSEKFLNMAGPLGIGLGVVFVSSLGSMFVPMTAALGAGLYSISLYGGLLLFSAFLLYDTQKVIKYAEAVPPNSAVPFDPINASMSIYLDTINIFIRIAQMYAMGGGGKKK